MALAVTLAAVLTVLFLLWLWVKRKFNYWPDRNVETIPHSYILGNLKECFMQRESFTDSVWNCYRQLKSKRLRFGGIYMLWSPFFVPIDIEIIKNILQVEFPSFVDRVVYNNEADDPLSGHLFNSKGRKWKLMRHKLSPTFTSGKMKMMFETVVRCTDGLRKVIELDLGKPVDIKDVAGRFTTDVIGSCAFGLECDSLTNPDSVFRKNSKAVFQGSTLENMKQFLIFVAPHFMKYFKATTVSREVTDFFLNIVKETVAYREKNNISRKDFMQLLIELKNEGKLVDDEKLETEALTESENRITIEEIAAHSFIFFFAGFETSSTTMSFALFELGKNKEIQKKTRDEIKRVLQKYDGKLTYESINEMVYLDRVVSETLRLYPPVTSLQRICNKPYQIPETDLVLEEGVRVEIPIIGIHRDPDYYPDPDKFDPDRFTEENKSTRPSFSYLPFGEGPRICIGLRFGLMQSKIGLISILSNFSIDVNKKTKEPIEFDPSDFMISAKGGLWLEFSKIAD